MTLNNNARGIHKGFPILHDMSPCITQVCVQPNIFMIVFLDEWY